jgi:hypothetical protein
MKHPEMQLPVLHTSPEAQLVPLARSVQAVVLVPGWQLRQALAGSTVPLV